MSDVARLEKKPMEHDSILLEMGRQEFVAEVKSLFRGYRAWFYEARAFDALDSHLAQSSLLLAGLLSGEEETLTPQTRARGVEALLQWAVAQIRPSTTEDFGDPAWRRYYSLYYLYLQRDTTSHVARKLGLSGDDSKIYSSYVDPAIGVIVDYLRKELETGEHVSARRIQTVKRRYYAHTPEQQEALRFATILRHPAPVTFFQHLLHRVGLGTVQFDDLQSNGLVVTIPEGLSETISMQVHPDALPYLIEQRTTNDESKRCYWRVEIANQYQQVQAYVEASYHYRMGDAFSQAADSLIDHYDFIVREGQIHAFQQAVAAFRKESFHPAVQEIYWARLNIAAGDAFMMIKNEDTKNLDAALAAYSAALSVTDLYYKALAYHRRAKAMEGKHANEAIAHYERGIELLTPVARHETRYAHLLVDMFIDEAWVLVQDKADTYGALRKLEIAYALVPQDDSEQRSRLLNAWARLMEKSEADLEQYIDLARRAYLLALETQDNELMLMTSHNLGMGYVYNGELELGNDYLQIALDIAQRIGHRPHEGKVYKTIGAYHFFKEEFAEAINYYQKAYAIAEEVGDRAWLGFICYDLAEGYATTGQKTEMHCCFAEAVAISYEVQSQELYELLVELSSQHEGMPPLGQALDSRKQAAYDYVKTHSRITRQEYIEEIERRGLGPLAERQATRHLRDMVKVGIFEERGNTRGIYYVLATL